MADRNREAPARGAATARAGARPGSGEGAATADSTTDARIAAAGVTTTDGASGTSGGTGTGATTAGPADGDLTAEDLARELLSRGTGGDAGQGGDLAALREVGAAGRAFREELGVDTITPAEEKTLVAVSTGTDLEKDHALCEFMDKHTEIETIKPAVLTQLGEMAGAVYSIDQAATPVGLDLLQLVLDIGGSHQQTCALIAKALAQKPKTVLVDGITVAEAKILLSPFVMTLERQQATPENRATRNQRLAGRLDKQAIGQHGAAQDQESVRRLRQKARDGQTLPALPQPPQPKGKTKKTTKKTKKTTTTKAGVTGA